MNLERQYSNEENFNIWNNNNNVPSSYGTNDGTRLTQSQCEKRKIVNVNGVGIPVANPKDSKIMVEMQKRLSSNLNYQLNHPAESEDMQR